MKTFKEVAIDQTLADMQETKTNLLDNSFRLSKQSKKHEDYN